MDPEGCGNRCEVDVSEEATDLVQDVNVSVPSQANRDLGLDFAAASVDDFAAKEDDAYDEQRRSSLYQSSQQASSSDQSSQDQSSPDLSLTPGASTPGSDQSSQSTSPSPVCPHKLHVVFATVHNRVNHLQRTDPTYTEKYYTDRILYLKNKVKKEKNKKKREELEGSILDLEDDKNRIPRSARTRVLLDDDHECVHSLRFGRCTERFADIGAVDDQPDAQIWQGEVWTYANKLEVIAFNESYVKTLLTPFAFKKRYFQSDEFIPLVKYDRQQTVDETHFARIFKVNKKNYTLIDNDGFRVFSVSAAWVHHYLPLEIWLELQKYPAGHKVHIPVGTSSPAFPMIKYHNESEQCLLKSLASALDYLGLTAKASLISKGYKRGYTSCDFVKSMAFIRETMIDEKKRNSSGQGKPIPFRKANYFPMDVSNRRPHPVLVSLKAAVRENGKIVKSRVNHCVCFVGNYIFDSNRDTALPISVASLNEICDSIVPGSTYDGIQWSRELLLKL